MPTDAELVVDLENRAEVHREPVAGGVETRVREVRSGGDAQCGERRTRRKARRNSERRWHDLRGEIGALLQLQRAVDVRDAKPELEVGTDLIADRRLDIDRADVGEIAEKAAWERVFIPFGLQAIRRVQADPRSQLRIDLGTEVNVGNRDDGVLEVALLGKEVVGKAAVRADERDAGAQLGPGKPGQSRGVEVDRRAVRAGPGRGDACASHGTGTVLVHPKPLCCQPGCGD